MEALERFRFTALTARNPPQHTIGSRPRRKKSLPPAATKHQADIAAPDVEDIVGRHSSRRKSMNVERDASSEAAKFSEEGESGFDELESCLLGATHNKGSFSDRLVEKESTQPGLQAQPGSQCDIASGRPPERWEEMLGGIRVMREERDAAVDLFGTRQCVDPDADLETRRFQALVAAMISSQTKDPVTAAAMLRLRALPGGLTIANIASPETCLETLQNTLHPVGFFRQKGGHLKVMAQQLAAPPHHGRVPGNAKQLMELPGVGPKVAHLTLVVAFDRPEDGLIVDTHVRRVSERLGWASPERTPEQTRLIIESWLPKDLWAETSLLLVGFGQQVCTPLRPRCGSCQISSMCPSAFKEKEMKVGSKPKSQAPSKRKLSD